MSGRRSHQRFNFSLSTEGTLRVLRDVLVESANADEIIAVSRQAAVVGETLTLQAATIPASGRKVHVTESMPVVTDGTVRHRLRLEFARVDTL